MDFIYGAKTMAMTQRDDTIESIKRLDALLEYAVMHGDEEEAERIRAELRKLTDDWTSPIFSGHKKTTPL